MGIELIIISDSHGRAIASGAEKLGINVAAVTFSGGYWHKGRFKYNVKGFLPGPDKNAREAMDSLKTELNVSDVMTAGIPVISTIGFHLGQLVPSFGWYGHRGRADELAQDPDLMFASDDFVSEFIYAFRKKHLKTAQLMSRSGRLIVIPPPLTFTRPNYSTFRETIKTRMATMDVEVHDVSAELAADTGILPDDLISSDGVHANDDYGVKVIEYLAIKKIL